MQKCKEMFTIGDDRSGYICGITYIKCCYEFT